MDSHQRQFDKELDDLKMKLIHMAATTETMIDLAIGELVNRDQDVASAVPDHEAKLDRLQIEIDDRVVTLIATHQPVAVDLRLLLATTKINSELERIGDLVVNITENAPTIINQPQLKPLIDIPRMADLARKMVRDSLHAFVKGDALMAQGVILADDQVDLLKDQIIRELVTYMAADPKAIERALALILIARHLERIADHATNIAEDVIYVIQGRDVRHPSTPREEQSDA
ncbi:MAG: phosphate signaling complex protein PhoU [Phycisphaerae bacterium]|jgi:phosphate transport system protein